MSKVLIVDDEPDVREVIGDFLRASGFEVEEAANGLEALLQVRRLRPDAVLLDLMMPRLGGLDAIKRIRAFDPRIRVLVMTGLADAELHRQARALGAAAVFTKPLATAEIVLALRGAPTAAPPPRAAEPAPRRADALSILLVEGEAQERAHLERLLAEKGYDVRLAPDAASGVRAVVARAPDIVLLDIEMPGLSGVGVLPTIVALAPDAKVIMVCESANVELAKRTLAFGAFDYLKKPVDVALLGQAIESALAMRRIDLAD
jgi:DNA-binding NtrC family response regulator